MADHAKAALVHQEEVAVLRASMVLPLLCAFACSTPEPRVGDERIAGLRDGMNPSEVGDATHGWLTHGLTAVSHDSASPGRTIGWYVWTATPGLVTHGTTGCRTIQVDFGVQGKLNLGSPRTTVVGEVLMVAPPGEADQKETILSKADVFDPKNELRPLAWPHDYDQEHRTLVEDLVDAVGDGGLEGLRAKIQLSRMGHGSLVGLINKLRNLDYFDSEDTMLAYELNRVLVEAVSVGQPSSQIGRRRRRCAARYCALERPDRAGMATVLDQPRESR